jgi:hypothetical protein
MTLIVPKERCFAHGKERAYCDVGGDFESTN